MHPSGLAHALQSARHSIWQVIMIDKEFRSYAAWCALSGARYCAMQISLEWIFRLSHGSRPDHGITHSQPPRFLGASPSAGLGIN